MSFRSVIIAEGSFLPGEPVSNDDIAKIVDTSNQWIESRTGIRFRHYAQDGQSASDMAVNAVNDACIRYNIDSSTIDGIICATSTPDLVFPSTASIICSKLKANSNPWCFDINVACAGFVYALSVADAMIKNKSCKRVAVIGADKMSVLINWAKRDTCVLFADGAGVMILEGQADVNNGILCSKILNFSHLNNILFVNQQEDERYICMKGSEVFRHAVDKMSSISADLLSSNGVDINSINWVIPHQANQRIIDAIAERLSISQEKMISSIAMHGNTSAASIPLAFTHYCKDNKFAKSDKIMMTALGAGIAAGAVLLEL